MTFYQELQLNQSGSKAVIRNAADRKERLYHTLVYVFKIFITMAFCMVFVMGYSGAFGSENSIVGVVVLLCIMVFRFADFGFYTPHAIVSLSIVFAILAVGPRLANIAGPVGELLVHIVCILALMVLSCHNVIMGNHSTLVLGYLLLYGYDVSGKIYSGRIAGLVLGAVLTGLVFYHNHRNKEYKRSFKHLLAEFQIQSSRTRWQLTVTLGIASVLFIARILQIPRAMWIGIAAMSVFVPFQKDVKERVKGRIPGNIAGGILFLILYHILPKSLNAYMGIIGGIGVSFSAVYGWQNVFNALGAISIAAGILGVPGAVFFRIINNAVGAVYALVFERIFHFSLNCISGLQTVPEGE